MMATLCSPLTAVLTLGLLVCACTRPTTPLFTVSTGAPSRAEPVALGDGILVGNEAGRLVRLDTQGRTVWKVELDREVAVAPAVSGDSVLVGSQGGLLLALGLAGGEERWRITGQAAPLAALVADPECVYVVEPGLRVRALVVKTGAVRWVRATTPAAASEGPARLLPTPTLSRDFLVVADATGLIALSPRDGAVRWRLPLAGVLGTRLGDGPREPVLYVSTRGGDVLALGLADGRVHWKKTLPVELTSPPGLALERVWVGTAEPGLLGLSLQDGSESSRHGLPGPLVAPVEGAGPWLVAPVRGREGWVLGLAPEASAPVFTLRLDTAVIARPVVLGDQLLVLGRDGRVQAWRLTPAAGSGR